jgi:hypothetical protein
MQNTYTLAIESEFALTDLALPPMTLAQAEKARDLLATYGKRVLVRNMAAL